MRRQATTRISFTLDAVTRLRIVACLLSIAACGDDLARISVSESAREVQFQVDEPGRVGFAASFEIENSDFRTREDVPHLVDYEIEIHKDGARVARLVCNPFDMSVRRSGKNGDLRLNFLSGALDGCDARLPSAGTYVVRARLVWVDPGRRIDFAAHTLSVER